MQLKVGTKIIGSSLVILLLMVVVGFLGQSFLAKTVNEYTNMTTADYPASALLSEYRYAKAFGSAALRGYLLTNDSKFSEQLKQSDAQADEILDRLSKIVDADEEKQFSIQLNEAEKAYKEISAKIFELQKSGNNAEALSKLEEAISFDDKVSKISDDWKKFIDEEITNQIKVNEGAAANSKLVIYIAILTAFIVGIGIALYIGRSISRSVNKLADIAKVVADGDLSQPVPEIKTGDEVQVLGKAFKTMVENLHMIIVQVNDSSNNVVATAAEISTASEHNSASSQQIAKAIEELAKGNTEQTRIINDAVNMVEQMTESIDSIAAGAQEQARNVTITSEQAATVSKRVQEVAVRTEGVKAAAVQNLQAAKKGGTAVNKAIDGMQRIQGAVTDSAKKITELGRQSQQIGEIIQVIDDIAEQTNLLALNAAIEAARAGEHGKGFAVVADEVRKLAERSGKATKEIAALITSIQKGTEVAVKSMDVGTKEVNDGVEIAKEAGHALNEILTIVEKTGAEVEVIARAIIDISVSTDEVSNAAENVAAITEENTASTEEMAAGSGLVNSSIISIASIAEESAAAAEEVSASTEEMNATTEEIAASARHMSDLARELHKLVAKFKV